MVEGRSLYEEDFALWTQEQAEAIRNAAASGANLPLDWDNLAEEIESLGRSLRSELRSRLTTVIEHLLKLEYSPAADPRRGWTETIDRERRAIRNLLDDNPSLRPQLEGLLLAAGLDGAEDAALSLSRYDELTSGTRAALAARRFTSSDVLDPWLPEPPSDSLRH